MSKLKPRTEKELKWISVDLDSTVAQNSGYPKYNLVKPIKGAKKALDKLVSKGFKIIIYTARPWDQYELIEAFLNKYKLPFRRIVCGKLFSKYMIDDRAIQFTGDWEEVISRIT